MIALLALLSFWSGNDLLESCRYAKTGSSACVMYIAGVADGEENSTGVRKITPYFCVPRGVTGTQVADVVVNWLERHPEKRHLIAGGLVQAALLEAFPCEGAAT